MRTVLPETDKGAIGISSEAKIGSKLTDNIKIPPGP